MECSSACIDIPLGLDGFASVFANFSEERVDECWVAFEYSVRLLINLFNRHWFSPLRKAGSNLSSSAGSGECVSTHAN